MAAKSDSLDDDLVTVREKTVRLPILHSGSVDDKVFFGPITEREKRARQLFQQRYGMKEPDLSVLDNMNDYLLNDSQSRQSMSLLGEIPESSEKVASHMNEFDRMDDISEYSNENISQTDSLQDLCIDIQNLNLTRPKYESHPDYSYIKIDPNYSLISEPEPRSNINIQPNIEGLSILSEAALIHSSQFSKSSEESQSMNSIDISKFHSKNNYYSETVKVNDTTMTREKSVGGPKFNDTLEALEELLSKRNQKESLAYPDTTTNLSDSQSSKSYQQTSNLSDSQPSNSYQQASNVSDSQPSNSYQQASKVSDSQPSNSYQQASNLSDSQPSISYQQASNLLDSQPSNSYQQTSIVYKTPIKYEQTISNKKEIQDLDSKKPELLKNKKENNLYSEVSYNNTLDSMEEFLSRKNEGEQSQIYPDSTSTFLNADPLGKNIQTINEISTSNQHSYYKLKNTQNFTDKDSPKLYDNTLDAIDAFLSEQNHLEKPTKINSCASTSTTPSSLTCNKKSSSSKIPSLSTGNCLKQQIKPKQQSSNIIRTPMSKDKMTTPFKTPTLSAQKPKKTPKFGHIISPVAAYINKPSPRLIQNVKCEKSINESKLRTPSSQKENMDTNNVSIQFPKVDYKQGPRLLLEEKTKSRFPHHLSPMMRNNLPESSPILCKHIGHLRIDGNNFENDEYSMVVPKN